MANDWLTSQSTCQISALGCSSVRGYICVTETHVSGVSDIACLQVPSFVGTDNYQFVSPSVLAGGSHLCK